MALLFIVLGIIFLIYGLVLYAFSNLNLGVLLIILIGILFLIYGIFHEKINRLTKKGILKYVKMAVIFSFIAEVAFIAFLGIYGERDNVTFKEDAVIVLGAGVRGDRVTLPLKYRLDKAIEYIDKNPEALIVVTGGKGFQETVTEAYAMEKYLLQNGVSREKIIKEEKAVSTNENMRFSKEILDEKFNSPYDVALITNGFHIYRGVSIAHREGFENVTRYHASLQWYNLLPCYLRESLAVLKMWVFG